MVISRKLKNLVSVQNANYSTKFLMINVLVSFHNVGGIKEERLMETVRYVFKEMFLILPQIMIISLLLYHAFLRMKCLRAVLN